MKPVVNRLCVDSWSSWQNAEPCIACPNCGAPARFLPVELGRPLKAALEDGRKPAKDEVLFKFNHVIPHQLDWSAVFSYRYRGFGSSQETDKTERVWNRLTYAALWLGSTQCERCHTPSKVKVSWPEVAYFSVDYRGRQLWFLDRAHASGFLELLQNPKKKSRYAYWFHRSSPTWFKTSQAREKLLPKVKRMLLS